MPDGKPAGVRCIQLTENNYCRLFGHPSRPAVCRTLSPTPEMCRDTDDAAMVWLTRLEAVTRPGL
jgi:hypothetical protein